MAQRKTTLGRGIRKMVRLTEKMYTVRPAKDWSAFRLPLIPRTPKSELKVTLKENGIAASRAMKKFGITDAQLKKELHAALQAGAAALIKNDKNTAERAVVFVSYKLLESGFDDKKINEFYDYFKTTMQRLTMHAMEEINERRLNRR